MIRATLRVGEQCEIKMPDGDTLRGYVMDARVEEVPIKMNGVLITVRNRIVLELSSKNGDVVEGEVINVDGRLLLG